jgi:MoaA/NifB/PqqE/SkfB family radical SAM enzyme
MCSRNYHGGIKNPLLKLSSWSLADFKKILTKEVLIQIKGFYFCGNFGDPIINDDLLEMIKYSVSINPNLYIRIHTNASARSEEWWKTLAKTLPLKHNVVFALDGLEDTHSIYRVGTDFTKIINNATAFIKNGGTAEWCFIKFRHNEHQVDLAKKTAASLGFLKFTEKNSARFISSDEFDVLDKNGNVKYQLYKPRNSKKSEISYDLIKDYKQILQNASIQCAVKKTKEIYIDAQRNVMPCCFLASTPYNFSGDKDIESNFRKDTKQQYEELRKELGDISALTQSIKSIISSETWQKVWDKYWNNGKLYTCSRVCGKLDQKISQPSDQFVDQIWLRKNVI